jgi:Mn2+/Fe2+ NRAMP family transporter
MKRILDITLGIVTSVGGFLEIGSITTAVQAGASFGYQLVWSVVLGVICIAFLAEMAGRFAAVSKTTIPDALRERFGVNFFVVVLVVMFGVCLLTLGAEVGGVAAALELATSLRLSVWAIPIGLFAWVVLWRSSFSLIENGVSLLGLVTLSFAVGAVKMHPSYGAVLHGVVPTLPHVKPAHYWFIAVSVLGASISPYLFFFYSSGAIEEKWGSDFIVANRLVAAFGMGFGGLLNIAVLVLGALIFHPGRIEVQHYEQLPRVLTGAFGHAGLWLFVACLGIGCMGATLEITLAMAYLVAQGLGWNWGENLAPRADARFSLLYTVILMIAALIVLLGVDPLALTEVAMVLTAASLPVGIFPFLILMNDRDRLGRYTNGRFGNIVVLAISGLAAIVALVSIPLQLIGG